MSMRVCRSENSRGIKILQSRRNLANAAEWNEIRLLLANRWVYLELWESGRTLVKLVEMSSKAGPRKSISWQPSSWNKIVRIVDISFLFLAFFPRGGQLMEQPACRWKTKRKEVETYANFQFHSYVMFSSAFGRGLDHPLSSRSFFPLFQMQISRRG